MRALAASESSCCSFFRFDIAREGDELRWTATAAKEKADAVQMFGVVKPAAELAPRSLHVLEETRVRLEHRGADLLDAREPQRLLLFLAKAFDRRAIGLHLRFEIAQRADDGLGAVAIGDELDQTLDARLRAFEALAAGLQLGIERAREVAQLLSAVP